MTKKLKNAGGFTLIELLLVIAITVLVAGVFIRLFSKTSVYFLRARVRQQVMRDSRGCMDTLLTRLRNGKARTLQISTPVPPPGQDPVPNSRVDFDLQTSLPSGATAYSFYVENKILYSREYSPSPPAPTLGAQPPRALASSVTGLIFTGDWRDPGLVNVSLRIDAQWDQTHDPSKVTTIFLPNQTVRMAESP